MKVNWIACLFLFSFAVSPVFAEETVRLPTSLSIPEAKDIPKTVGIGLLVNVPSVSIETNAPYEIKKEAKNHPLLLKSEKSLKDIVLPEKEGLKIGNTVYSANQLVISASNGWIQVNKRKYFGQVRIVKNSNQSITVINEIDLEEYLKGVLPLEVPFAWPAEALKAHAVISRTYALFKTIEKKDAHYSLRDTVESQMYGGASFHKKETDAAADATRGEILTFKGKIFPSYFHSNCGGETAKADVVWLVKYNPVLNGVKCPYCRHEKNWQWSLKIPLLEIESILQKKDFPAKNLKTISFIERDPSGRATKVVLEYQLSTLTLKADDFRSFLGNERLKSLKVNVEIKDGKAYFHGFGWGHGIGLCQWGTKRQAQLGKSYREILEFYFPGSEIKKIT